MALESPPVRLAEAIAVAFLAGWLISPRSVPARGPVPSAIIRAAGFALIGLILASAAAVTFQVRAYVPEMWPGLFSRTHHEYFAAGPDAFGAIAGGRLIEGLGLSAAVVALLRRRPILAVWIPEALGVGCVTAVIAAYSLWYGVAFPAVLLRYSLIGERIVAHVADINAAGSYFALMVFVAAGMAGRESGQRRLSWAVVLASAGGRPVALGIALGDGGCRVDGARRGDLVDQSSLADGDQVCRARCVRDRSRRRDTAPGHG